MNSVLLKASLLVLILWNYLPTLTGTLKKRWWSGAIFYQWKRDQTVSEASGHYSTQQHHYYCFGTTHTQNDSRYRRFVCPNCSKSMKSFIFVNPTFVILVARRQTASWLKTNSTPLRKHGTFAASDYFYVSADFAQRISSSFIPIFFFFTLLPHVSPFYFLSCFWRYPEITPG